MKDLMLPQKLMLRLLAIPLLLAAPAPGQDVIEVGGEIFFQDIHAELVLAIEMNDLEETRRVIEEEGGQFEINEGDPSPLRTAVELDNLQMVALLLRSGGDPNSTADSPLLAAVRNGQLQMTRLLLRAGAEVPGQAPERSLFEFALRGDDAVPLYGELLDAGGNADLALEVAVAGGHAENAWLAIERDADVGVLDPEADLPGLLPRERLPGLMRKALAGADPGGGRGDAVLSYFLFRAAISGDRELATMAFERGGRPTLAHLERAEANGHNQVALDFLDHMDQDLGELVTQAEAAGSAELAHFLKGVRTKRLATFLVPAAVLAGVVVVVALGLVSFRRGLMQSPKQLHQAVEVGDVETVRKMLHAGADANALYQDGGPLHTAAASGEVKVARTLLHHGARLDVPSTDELGLLPLHVAAATGNLELVELFLRSGAAVDPRDGTGRTPLFVAALSGHVEVMSLLLEHGADLGVRIGDESLLLAAVSDRATEAAKVLLAAGARLDADRPRTVLHVAVGIGDAELVGLLVERGADLEARDANGRTALELALFLERPEVIAALRPPSR